MNRVEDKLQEALKPGTITRKVFFALAFFVTGLLFVWIGFWQTLLIAALTLVGLYIGSSDSLVDSVKKIINKAFPPRKKPVTYSAEDIQKVREAREQGRKREEAQKTSSPPEPPGSDAAKKDQGKPKGEPEEA